MNDLRERTGPLRVRCLEFFKFLLLIVYCLALILDNLVEPFGLSIRCLQFFTQPFSLFTCLLTLPLQSL